MDHRRPREDNILNSFMLEFSNSIYITGPPPTHELPHSDTKPMSPETGTTETKEPIDDEKPLNHAEGEPNGINVNDDGRPDIRGILEDAVTTASVHVDGQLTALGPLSGDCRKLMSDFLQWPVPVL